MSKEKFKLAYQNSDVTKLRKYMKLNPGLSVHKFMNYVTESFMSNRVVYDVLVLILFNQYDLNEVVEDIIDRDNVDLLENVLSNDYGVKLDERLILRTVEKGRVSMAKAIYEYIYGGEDSYAVVNKLLRDYDFVYNKNENSVDSFVVALYRRKYKHAELIIPYINPNFWNDFAIKYTVRSNYDIASILLSHSAVDPEVDDNILLKQALQGGNHFMANELLEQALQEGNHFMANELLKHPLVAIEGITTEFVVSLVKNNRLCVAERLLRSENHNVISLFKQQEIIKLMAESYNDVMFLAIKLKIVSMKQLFKYSNDRHKARKYLKKVRIDKHYFLKPYAQNLDPEQIYERALENNDIDLAKSILDYPISISIDWLFECLLNRDFDDELVSDYIWNTVMATYDPDEFLIKVGSYDEELIDDVLEVIDDAKLKLDYEYICKFSNCMYVRQVMWSRMKKNCSVDRCEKFIVEYTGEDLCEDSEELSEKEMFARMDDLFIKYG